MLHLKVMVYHGMNRPYSFIPESSTKGSEDSIENITLKSIQASLAIIQCFLA